MAGQARTPWVCPLRCLFCALTTAHCHCIRHYRCWRGLGSFPVFLEAFPVQKIRLKRLFRARYCSFAGHRWAILGASGGSKMTQSLT